MQALRHEAIILCMMNQVSYFEYFKWLFIIFHVCSLLSLGAFFQLISFMQAEFTVLDSVKVKLNAPLYYLGVMLAWWVIVLSTPYISLI